MKITQTLGLEYVEPLTGVYNKILWSYKSTAKVIRLCLVTLFKSPGFRCDHINITISIDHGKGYSRPTLNVIPCWQLADGSWGEESQVFTLANARCKKDNTNIIRNTFGTLLDTKLKLISEWVVVSIVNGEVEWGGGGEETQQDKRFQWSSSWRATFCSMPSPLARKALLLGGATGVSYSKPNGKQQIIKLVFLGTWSH
jgi:hypothetical protein